MILFCFVLTYTVNAQYDQECDLKPFSISPGLKVMVILLGYFLSFHFIVFVRIFPFGSLVFV